MLTAYLYIRVSTDEQAAKGYSQRSQSDWLTNYCRQNQISIAETIFEDYPAKTFNRPGWNELYAKLKASNNQFPIILITHWDRFSRNITDAYRMLEQLKKIKVLIQAIEQPIDFTVPESKIMLAMYLATSEVENDKRSRNVSLGMQKARLEGRWINRAPMGYKNRITADGQKYIAPYEPEATIISEAFENIVKQKGISLSKIYKQALTKGLHCSRSAFYQLVRSPVYCGKIVIPSTEEEKSRIIEGTHKKIISVTLFEQVQKILGKRRSIPKTSKRTINEKFLLRGVLLCPQCGKTLTASTSQGKSKKYDYYHCLKGCSYRIRAEHLNSQFLSFLKSLKTEQNFVELNHRILKEIHSEKHADYNNKKLQINTQINKFIDRSLNAQQLFSKGEIDYDDYLLIRENCKKSLQNLTNQLQEQALNYAAETFTAERGDIYLERLGEFYESSDIPTKQKINRLLFPEKTILDSQNLVNMLPEPIKSIFGLNKYKNKKLQGQQEIEKHNEEIIQFLKEVIFLDFEHLKNEFQ